MAFNFFATLGQDDRIEDAEIALTAADDEEAKSLPLHNSRCQKRYRYTILRLNSIDRKIMAIFVLLAVQIFISIASSDKALAIVHRVLG